MYFNTLIIMNEDALGYGNRSRKPSGYCKLTMPNRVSCYVQGLRQLPKGQIYRLYLTSKSKQRSVEVGMLQVGINGNKETRWVMNPSSINNSGLNAEEIDGGFIIVSGDNIQGNVVPLVGFSSEPYAWEHLVKNSKTAIIKETANATKAEGDAVAEKTPQIVSQIEPIQIEPIQIEPTQPAETESIALAVGISQSPGEEVEPEPIFRGADQESIDLDEKGIGDQARNSEMLLLKEEVEKLNRTLKESKAIIEALQQQAARTEETTQMDLRHLEPKLKSVETPSASTYMEPPENVSGINEYMNNFLRAFQKSDEPEHRVGCSEVGSIFKKRIPINPFEAQNTGIKWVRITYEDLKSVPSLDSEWTNQAFIMDAYRDYKHFILGKDESGIGYHLGVPGVFNPNEDNPLNIDKIERFSCCHNIPPRAREAGYWIAMV
ncbi:MAG TPA: hypothetical protein GX707_18960 [Epulopiscium sp.]|nr:hypothetical protein [Candidatus Epulonipiscium sp.]